MPQWSLWDLVALRAAWRAHWKGKQNGHFLILNQTFTGILGIGWGWEVAELPQIGHFNTDGRECKGQKYKTLNMI